MEILSQAQIQHLAAFRQLAVPDSQELVTNIDRLIEVQRQAEASTAELHKQEVASQAMLEELNQKRVEIARLVATFNAEKIEFERVRQSVDAERKDREASLLARADALSQLKADLSERAAELAEREAAIADLMKKNTDEATRLAEDRAQFVARVAKLDAVKAAMAEVG